MERYKDWDIEIPHFYCMEYYEGNRKMVIEMDFRDPIYRLNPRMIEHWEPPYYDAEITEKDKSRILQNIRQFLLSRGTEPGTIIMEDM